LKGKTRNWQAIAYANKRLPHMTKRNSGVSKRVIWLLSKTNSRERKSLFKILSIEDSSSINKHRLMHVSDEILGLQFPKLIPRSDENATVSIS
jgi:hypothetical protein